MLPARRAVKRAQCLPRSWVSAPLMCGARDAAAPANSSQDLSASFKEFCQGAAQSEAKKKPAPFTLDTIESLLTVRHFRAQSSLMRLRASRQMRTPCRRSTRPDSSSPSRC